MEDISGIVKSPFLSYSRSSSSSLYGPSSSLGPFVKDNRSSAGNIFQTNLKSEMTKADQDYGKSGSSYYRQMSNNSLKSRHLNKKDPIE